MVAKDEESGERATASLDIEVLQRGQSGMFHNKKRVMQSSLPHTLTEKMLKQREPFGVLQKPMYEP